MQGPAREQVEMQVKDRLPGIRTVIGDQPERISHAELTRDLAGFHHEMPEQGLIIRCCIGEF